MADGPVNTFEGAAVTRAAHARFERDPVFDDTWAIKLISSRNRWKVRIPPLYRRLERGRAGGSRMATTGMSCLRLADELVERAVADGIHQYVVLSAGLDSFGVRRRDLSPPLRVFELDHPDAQAVKRQRVRRAVRRWPESLELVPIDFETTAIPAALGASTFDPAQPAVASWLNSIPYITEAATIATLEGLATVLAPGSRVVFNYPPKVRLTAEQERFIAQVRASVARMGEPFRSAYVPDRMVAIVEGAGFKIDEHLTEQDLADRYLSGRGEGTALPVPARVIVATRVGGDQTEGAGR
jgi:methyltransferase (TIGR00027 family)